MLKEVERLAQGYVMDRWGRSAVVPGQHLTTLCCPFSKMRREVWEVGCAPAPSHGSLLCKCSSHRGCQGWGYCYKSQRMRERFGLDSWTMDVARLDIRWIPMSISLSPRHTYGCTGAICLGSRWLDVGRYSISKVWGWPLNSFCRSFSPHFPVYCLLGRRVSWRL